MFLTGSEGFQKFARGVLYVFIATFPFLLYRGFLFNGTSGRAFNLVLIVEVLAVCFGVLLLRKKTQLSIKRSPISLALVVLFGVLCLASLVGVDVATSFWSKATRTTGLFYFIHLGFFYFLITMLFDDARRLRTLTTTFVVSSAVFSLAATARDGLGLIYTGKEWAGFTFGNSTFAAMYLFAAFVMSVYLAYSNAPFERRWWHFVLPFAIIANPYFIGYIGGTSLIGSAQASSYALYASVIMLAGAWAISKIRSVKIRRHVIWAAAGIGLIAGVFAITAFLSPTGVIQRAYLEQASAARPMVWQLSRESINDRPLLGWGIDNFDRAFETHYDNCVMERGNGGEAWFDRAHNIFIDQAVESGYVGVAAYLIAFLTVIGCMLYVIMKATAPVDCALATFIIVYFIGHLMELQTAFDTSISYVPLALMAGLATILYARVRKQNGASGIMVPMWLRTSLGGILIAGSATLFFAGTVPVFKAQIANGAVRTVGSSDKRLPIYEALFDSPIDQAGFLNRTATDLQRGISVDPTILEKPGRIDGFKKELDLLAAAHVTYLEEHPENYRARIRLADIYIYGMLFGVDNLDKAHANADFAISVAPELPQAYWQHAVAYLYQRKFPEAREWAKKALELNPAIEESQRLQKYIEDSIKTFPEIELYNFIML